MLTDNNFACDRSFFLTDLQANIAAPAVCTHGSFQFYITNCTIVCTNGWIEASFSIAYTMHPSLAIFEPPIAGQPQIQKSMLITHDRSRLPLPVIKIYL